MSIYDRISKDIGRKNWLYSIFHDDGNVESDGGGKCVMYIAPPGKGKSTLMAQAAQLVRSISGASKKSYIYTMDAGRTLDQFVIEPETVIWRIREFDNFGSLIPQNWLYSNPKWNVYTKPVHVFVHEHDNPLFYCIKDSEPISPINMVPLERYHGASDLMNKLHWNAINCVLEPQTYRLSPNLIFALRKHKMDDDFTERDADGNPIPNSDGTIKKKKIKYKKEIDYAGKFIDPAYFWYDLIDIAIKSNQRKHITLFIDEFHDVAEADCEGDAWKLVSILATKIWPSFRKNNISLHLSTHQIAFVDYRIARRVEYINWFRGAKISPNFSMINTQAILSNLAMGQLITEEANTQFGLMTFDRIERAPPQVYVHGLAGQNPAILPSQVSKLMKIQDELQPPDYTRITKVRTLPEIIEI